MILYAVLILGGLGIIFGSGLALAGKKFAVPVDPNQEKLLKVLPGINCGACGMPGGCSGYAEALVKGGFALDLCVVGGEETARKIAEILGKEASIKEPAVARVLCQGGNSEKKYEYSGIRDCYAAKLVSGGFKSCRYGCLLFGTCVEVCPFDAFDWREGDIPRVIDEKCRACGKCVDACPVGIIKLIPRSVKVYVNCSSRDKGASVRKICKDGCFTCNICVKACPQKAITIEDNLPVIDRSKCNGCGICVEKCPSHAIKFMREGEGVGVMKDKTTLSAGARV